MFKLNEIRELVRLIDETSVTELNVEAAGTKLIIKKEPVVAAPVVVQPAAVQASQAAVVPVAPAVPAQETAAEEIPKKTAPAVEDPTLHKIVSPMVGTFYKAPAPDAEPYVRVGSKVNEKTVVCIVEAMKLMNEIEADVRGEIVEILVENGQLVEYGQPLFLVKVD
ncbi:acetyl-CoA carboxylase biotin carboxyl carrier protein [Effusibacillus lacus]|uniref:Biotin carboxyl carrier protein of acetyl-CoA carboxylase n=1 Tax=Effusibacillus lacus TaxID=1348429 RepID=A0A292YPS6_9BACL|nr:acetyl-CoA carboxylase biotin carboxyl carrier protein [Effusibacillus lacus]TCS72528.1 acetyl-CoA carboxylase biotin carboxyl carrier protein [Effusibacillus lacus]GAX90909.1 acetyl-CoA carboxylase, biotin carboxyl carrier protein [Effusibacillus lacus]